MTASNPLFADDCSSSATVSCVVIGQIAGPGQSVPVLLPADASVAAVTIKNKGVGTLGFQMSTNGVDWVPSKLYSQPGNVPAEAVTVNGTWRGSVAGMAQFRVVSGDDYVAGPVTEVIIRISPADLFVEGPEEDVGPTLDVLQAPIIITETGAHVLVPADPDNHICVHRMKFTANELVRVQFTAGVSLSGWEICDSQMLDFDADYPWYKTAVNVAFNMVVLKADGTGTPVPLPVTVGGTVWYTIQPPPVILP